MMYNFLMQELIYDTIILGSGPAGLTAAIYTSRASLRTLVIAGSQPGGQLTTTTEVENFPGFPKGITGPELMANMREQAQRFEVAFVDDDAVKVSGDPVTGFTVETSMSGSFKAKTIIVASGATAKWLDIESEKRLRGKGVSACATCDGFFFKDKIVAVVGGGDAAMEEATFLTHYCTKVYLLARTDEGNLRASKIMQKRAMDNPKIEFKYNTEVSEVLGDNFVSGLRVRNNKTGEESVMSDVQGLFVAIGHHPNTDFIKDFVEVDHVGYIKVTDNTRTSKEGVFVAGDVADFRYRQAISAAGLGCMAALDAQKYLAELH
jgi:thioredoxin reductase (NADPH)